MSETIADLKPDKCNARKHTPRNIGMIEKSLQEVGAARSIVIDEDNNILAGNGTVEAAGNAGIEKMQIVETDGNEIVAVRRRGLSVDQKKKLALYDNRTAELADWNVEAIQELNEEIDLSEIFDDDILQKDLRTLQHETLIPFTQSHILISFPPDKADEVIVIVRSLEKIIGVEVEHGAN